MAFKIGNKVKINGLAEYSQDMCSFKGEVLDIIFTIESLMPENRVQLIAPGYGKIGPARMYGNGAIYINKKYLIKATKKQEIAQSLIYKDSVIKKKDEEIKAMEAKISTLQTKLYKIGDVISSQAH